MKESAKDSSFNKKESEKNKKSKKGRSESLEKNDNFKSESSSFKESTISDSILHEIPEDKKLSDNLSLDEKQASKMETNISHLEVSFLDSKNQNDHVTSSSISQTSPSNKEHSFQAKESTQSAVQIEHPDIKDQSMKKKTKPRSNDSLQIEGNKLSFDDHESLGTTSTSQTKEKSKLDEESIYSKEVEEINSALKIKQNPDVKVLKEEIQIKEMENLKANFNDKDLPLVEEGSSFQLQKTEASIDSAVDSLFDNNLEELNLPNQSNEDEALLAADYSDSINVLEKLLLSIQKKLAFSTETYLETDLLNNPSKEEIGLLMGMGKERHYPMQYDVLDVRQSEIQDICTPTLTTTNFNFDESQKHFYTQKVASMIGELKELTPDSEHAVRIIYQYILIIECIQHWIEFLETWILRIAQLPPEQHQAECKLIEKQLTNLQEYLASIIDYKQNISEILPFDAKNDIAKRCENLQEQFDSTKQHAATTFTQVSGWIKKSGKIEDELRCLNASLQNEDNKLDILQKEKKYDLSEIEPLDMRIHDYCNKCETLCLYKQKFSLNWTGCQLENNESSLNWYKMMKLKVLQTSEIAKNSKYYTEDYQLSKELLNQLLHLLENQISEQTYVENLDELKKKKELLKDSMHSLEAQLWIVKKDYHASIHTLPSVTFKDEDYHLIISKAEDVMEEGQIKYQDWNQKEIQFTQLDDLIQKSSHWLHEKNQLKSKVNSKDLPNSYDILKNLQWDLSNFSPEIDSIKALKEDITAHTKIASIENSSTEVINLFKELHNSIDLELNKNVLKKEWTELKREVKDLHHCLSASNKQITRMHQKINHLGSDDSILKLLQDISKIETEMENRKSVNEWIRDNINCEEFSNTIGSSDNESRNLQNICDQWNQVTESSLQIKKLALQKIIHSERNEIRGKLRLWVKDVEDSFSNIVLDHSLSNGELKNIKHKLIGFRNILDIVIDYLNQDTQESAKDLETDTTDTLDKDKVEMLKMKLNCDLERCETLIFQNEENFRLQTEVNFTLERMENFLNDIRNKIWQMSHFEVSKSKIIVEGFQTLLSQKMFQDIKKLNLETTETHANKNFNLHQELSAIDCLISSVLGEINEYLFLWNEYQEAELLCCTFISKKMCTLSICCESIVNMNHLNQSIKILQNIQKDIKCNQQLEKNLKSIGSEFGKHIEGDLQCEIHNRVQSLLKKWVELKEIASKLCEEQIFVEKEWSEWFSLYDALSSWISSRQNEEMCSNLNRPYSVEEYELIMEELDINKCKLTSFQEVCSRLLSSSLLHSFAKDNMNAKLYSLNSSLQSLEEVLLYSHQRLLEINQERNIDKEILRSAEIFADDIENKFEFEIPLCKLEIESSLTLTKNSLVDAAYHCSAVEYIRRRLLFDEILDFEIANNVSKALIRLQKITSMLTSHYLKLNKVYFENNSISEKVMCILKCIKTSRKNLGEDLPSSYSDLLKFFMNIQLMDVYIYNYRPVLEDIIKESLKQSRGEDASIKKYAVESCKELQKEWDSLDSTYEIKINEIKKAIRLWETYLHCINDVKIWNRKAERNQKLYPKILKSSEIKNEISVLEKFVNNQEMFPCMMEKAKEIAEELGSTVNPVIRNNLLDEILSLQETSQLQADLLKNILKELKEALICSEKLESDLFKIKESVASICPFVDKCILSGPEMLNDKLQDIQVKLGKLKEISLMLNELECQAEELKKKTLCDNYYSQICTQKEIVRILSSLLEQCVVKLSEAPNERNKFEDMQKMLLKWNEITENEINRHYQEPPEIVLNKIETCIKSEVSENLNLLQQITQKGQWILENEKETDLISNVISSCTTTTSKVSTLVDSRNKELQQILSQKERAILLREKVEVFLNSSEQYLHTPVQFNEVSLRNVNDLIQATQNLQNDIQFQDETIETLRNDTEELMEKQDAFTCASEKNLFKHSTQRILNKWILVKALFSERYVYLTSVKTSWENILQLLNDLEDWLESKKKIVSQTDYIESDLPRSVYLDGIKIFENLKHNFQDDIHLLHNVNAAYHKTAKKDLDVNNCLKNQVLELNNQWRILYQKVCDIHTAINNILQLWEDYDQLHEHLHLFLTETHIKITELEHNNTLNQSECDSILADFEHHKITLERYISMANNLQQKSQCSTEEIKRQVEEIQKYWEEVYGCLKHYRESVLKKSELENKNLLQQTSISPQSAEPSYILDKQSAATLEQFGNVPHQTVDEDGITSSADNFETDSVLGTSNKDTDDVASVCQQGLYRQKTNIKSSKDVEDEFIKDLLAALKEAEERIESLETVLSEPTPCGTEDGNPPNYSRLLAACRSSIDVIQHLDHLFSERTLQESSLTSDEDIQSRTEGMLNRWEKIEAATLDKESRAIENAKKWQQFSRELQCIEKWLLDTLDMQTSQTIEDIDVEKFIIILQKHEKLITQITEQKQTILTLNLTGQKFMSKSRAKDDFAAVEEKLKIINDHWDKLCTVALEWQNRLQTEFLQSSEFRNTISEMELWLEDSKEKIQLVDLTEECSTTVLHEQHTEFFALKQQLENCSQRVKTLLDVSVHLFEDKEKLSTSSDEILDTQTRLHSILDLSHSLLSECTGILASLSALLTSRMALQEKSSHIIDSNSNDDENPNRISKCCNFLLRVVRASFPIQAVLLLLLGAALLLPKDEEELSCRFSNNFASSLNPMLHYPDGPPPV